MENRYIMLVVSVAIAVILVAVLLVPLINEYSDDTSETKTNIGVDMAQIGSDTSKTITVSGHTATIDGTDYTYTHVLVTDRIYMQWIGGGTNALGLRGLDDDNTWLSINLSSATITISGKTILVSGTTTGSQSFEDSWTVGWGFHLLNDGGYSFINTASTVFYVEDVSQIYSYFTWASAISPYTIFGSAAGTTATLNKADGTTETKDITYTTSQVSDTDLLSLTFSSSLFDVKINTTSATIQGVVVPTTATGATFGHDFMPLLVVIPVVIFAAIILAVARFMVLRE